MSGPVHEPDPRGREPWCGWNRRVRCSRPARRRCRSTSRSAPPPSPTGGSPSRSRDKIKKRPGGAPPTLVLAENPDILKTLSHAAGAAAPGRSALPPRPEDLVANARRKLAAKGCDWIVANDVSREQATFGGVYNTVQLIRSDAEPETWPKLAKARSPRDWWRASRPISPARRLPRRKRAPATSACALSSRTTGSNY